MIIETTYAVASSPFFWETLDFWDFILTVISIFVLASGVLSILFILYWGLLLILSWWKEDKIKPAINTIRYAILWLVITVLAIFLFPILGNLLWIDVEKYAKPSKILEKIESIWDRVFWKWTTTSYNNSNYWDIDNLDENSFINDL